MFVQCSFGARDIIRYPLSVSIRTRMFRLARLLRYALLSATFALFAACAQTPPPWQLNDVRGHLPDLQFNLTSDGGKPVTAADFRGKYVLMYFGYTHCPDVCPLTLVHLHLVMRKLGSDAGKLQILFVSVDPDVARARGVRVPAPSVNGLSQPTSMPLRNSRLKSPM